MQVANRTNRTLWIGLYTLADAIYGFTTFPWGVREQIHPNSTVTVNPSGARQQIIFWDVPVLGTMVTKPKSIVTSEATVAEDSHGCFVYNRLGPPTPIDKIDHLAVLVLENRSFDNLLGWLYSDSGNVPPRNVPASHTGTPYFLGLTELAYWNTNPASIHNTAPISDRVYARKGTTSAHKPDPNPGEVCPSFVEQMYGTSAPAANQKPNMWGFLQNYAKVKTNWMDDPCTYPQLPPLPNPDPNGIMECYTPDQVPVLSQLAKSYAVCDRWFGPLPCETFPSRSFLHAGTSFGRLNGCDQEYEDCCIPNVFVYAGKPTIFDALDLAGVHWAVYQKALVVGTLLSTQFWSLYQKQHRGAFHLEDLAGHLSSARPPQYIFIEPGYGLEASDQHPPRSLVNGESLISDVYHILRTSPTWWRTMLVITYDEHGGCYDHVPPPSAPRPDQSKLQFAVGGLDPYTVYGPRVPAVLVSPYIEPGTVLRGQPGAEFDHTSVLASIRDWMFPGKPDLLGPNERIRTAATFWSVLTLADARQDEPPVPTATDLASQLEAAGPLDSHGVRILALLEGDRRLLSQSEAPTANSEVGSVAHRAALMQAAREELEQTLRQSDAGEQQSSQQPPT